MIRNMCVALYESVPLLDAIEESVIVAGHSLHPAPHVDLALRALENLLERRADEQPLAALADGVAEPLQTSLAERSRSVQPLTSARSTRTRPPPIPQRRATRRDSAAKNGSSSTPTQRGQRDRSRPLNRYR
jgi:hypothetical protein